MSKVVWIPKPGNYGPSYTTECSLEDIHPNTLVATDYGSVESDFLLERYLPLDSNNFGLWKHNRHDNLIRVLGGDKGPNGIVYTYHEIGSALNQTIEDTSLAVFYSRVEKDEMPLVTNYRASILDEAKEIVSKDRNLDYGDPERNCDDIAKLWSIYKEVEFTAHDVAIMMILLKISRVKTSPGKRDHWVDMAGYSAVGAECVDFT